MYLTNMWQYTLHSCNVSLKSVILDRYIITLCASLYWHISSFKWFFPLQTECATLFTQRKLYFSAWKSWQLMWIIFFYFFQNWRISCVMKILQTFHGKWFCYKAKIPWNSATKLYRHFFIFPYSIVLQKILCKEITIFLIKKVKKQSALLL